MNSTNPTNPFNNPWHPFKNYNWIDYSLNDWINYCEMLVKKWIIFSGEAFVISTWAGLQMIRYFFIFFILFLVIASVIFPSLIMGFTYYIMYMIMEYGIIIIESILYKIFIIIQKLIDKWT